MVQKQFAENVKQIVSKDDKVVGLAVAGSWLTGEIDDYSDIDLILVTDEKISNNKTAMLDYASSFGKLLAAFTGEHVGEPRLLICLYDQPLLHVDIKFVTPEEFHSRIETPVILFDRNDELKNIIEKTEARFPYPDFQWIEDRFWVWVHYVLLKIGRGEYFEAYDSFSFLRAVVFGPLLHIKKGNLPRGVRKVEAQLSNEDFIELKSTIAQYDKASLISTLENAVGLYRKLRDTLFPNDVVLKTAAEEKVMQYLSQIKIQKGSGAF